MAGRLCAGQTDPCGLYGYKDIRAEQEAQSARRRSLNQAAFLDHYEAMAFEGYQMAAHQLGQLNLHHQQMHAVAVSRGYEGPPPPQPGFLHPHMMPRHHAPLAPPPLTPASASAPSSSSDGCYPPPSSSFPLSAPPMLSDTGPQPSELFEYHLAAAAAAAAAAGDPGLLASRMVHPAYRVRRSSIDLPLEGESGSGGGSGSYSRLQPVTEELYSYLSPEHPLPPGSLLLHHVTAAGGGGGQARSPEPPGDSLASSSDASDFQSPPPLAALLHHDSSAAQCIPLPSSHSSSSAPPGYDYEELRGGPQYAGDLHHGHPPSQPCFLLATPSSELPPGGTPCWPAGQGGPGIPPAQSDITYHEQQVQTTPPQPSPIPPVSLSTALPQQVVQSSQISGTSVQSPPHTTPLSGPLTTQPVSQPTDQCQHLLPPVSSTLESCQSECSGQSDSTEPGGRHEGCSVKRHQRRSVRSRSRQDRIGRAKLNVLNISNIGDRVAECQLETHNRKMVTFRFDLDGDNPEEIAHIMVESDFILESERESFIDQVREVIDTADERRDTHRQMPGDLEQQMPVISTPMQDQQSQVVHSAGRRFIVSPVPESRLREQFSPWQTPPTPSESGSAPLGLSQSAGSVSLQQAFSELRQNQHWDAGPSTAPPSVPSTLPPPLQAPSDPPPTGAPAPTHNTTAGAGVVGSNSQAQEPLPPLPSTSSCSTSLPPPGSSPSPQQEVQAQAVPVPSTQASSTQAQGASTTPAAAATVTAASSTLPTASPPLTTASSLSDTPVSQGISDPLSSLLSMSNSIPTSLPNSIPTSLPNFIPPSSLPSIPVSNPTSLPTSSLSSILSSPPSSLSSTVVPAPQTAPPLTTSSSSVGSSSGVQPTGGPGSAPVVQSTLVHSQPQTAAQPGQTHTHCAECDVRCEGGAVECLGKADDIHMLDKKLRSLFMDLPTGGELPSGSDPGTGASVAGTSSPLAPPSSTSTVSVTASTTSSQTTTTTSSSNPPTPQPPTSLALGTQGATTAPSQAPGTPGATPAPVGVTASPFSQTSPSKTPISRLLSQQPLEDLDAQLRRALSPETVPVSPHTQACFTGTPSGPTPIPFSVDEELVPPPPATAIKLGRFQVSVATQVCPVKRPSSSTSSSSSSSSSSAPSSPDNTLHRKPSSPLRGSDVTPPGMTSPPLGGSDVVDGPPARPPGPQPTVIGRFQVITKPEARVGRFSVSQANEEGSAESGQAQVLAAANGAAGADSKNVSTASYVSQNSITSSISQNNRTSSASSDEDSEFEDEAFKMEVNRLREKHMREIQSLHTKQREEIDCLFTRLGKVPPVAVVPPVMVFNRRRRPAKSKSSKSSRTSSTQTSKSPLQPGPGSTLSAQSVPSIYPGQTTLLAPAGLANSGSSSLLQPLKPAPSGDNLGSAYTSDAGLGSVPSLGAPTTGCVGFSWGSERLPFKPTGRRTRFLRKMVKKVCPCNQLCRTTSTTAVGGQCMAGHNAGSQSLPTSVSAPPHPKKGTFTDDLHKLVDNWARDAMNLSQGKRSAKQLPQTQAQGHSYEAVQSANPGRKYSAPSQLCPSSVAAGTVSASSLTSSSARKGSLCRPASCSSPPLAPQWRGAAQWCGPTTPGQHHQVPVRPESPLTSSSQPLSPTSSYPGGAGGGAPLQAFHLPGGPLQKAVSHPGKPDLRTT